MKRFELTLVDRDKDRSFLARSIDKVEGNDLTELLAQFMFVINNIHRRELEDTVRRMQADDDAIPF